MGRRPVAEDVATLRIGEVAKLTGLTPRTLRYWEEVGLLRPSDHRESGERLYTPADMARVGRIRDLQELLGFSLAEVRMVVDTEDVDVLDRLRSTYASAEGEQRRQLVEDAIDANDRLLDRLEQSLRRIEAFRDERRQKGARLREVRRTLVD